MPARARGQVVSSGGWVTCCMFAHALRATAALEPDKDSRKGSRKKEPITHNLEASASGTGPAAAGHRTTHPHTDLEITTAATAARTCLYQRAIILLLLLLSASPKSYSHHRALGYRKPQAMNVPFLPRDANFPPHVHDKRKTKMTAAMERHQNSVPKGTTLAAATQKREPVLRGPPPPRPYITQTARKK